MKNTAPWMRAKPPTPTVQPPLGGNHHLLHRLRQDKLSARLPQRLVRRKAPRDVLTRGAARAETGERDRILERHPRALSERREHRVRGVPGDRDAAADPRREERKRADLPQMHRGVVDEFQEGSEARREVREGGEELGFSRTRVPL